LFVVCCFTHKSAQARAQENKVYVPKPLLVRGDGPVPKLRRWYSQFYSDVNRIVDGQSDCMAHIEW
jgi:hypothetical protein